MMVCLMRFVLWVSYHGCSRASSSCYGLIDEDLHHQSSDVRGLTWLDGAITWKQPKDPNLKPKLSDMLIEFYGFDNYVSTFMAVIFQRMIEIAI